MIKAKYGTAMEILKTFNPDNQVAFVRHEERCFSGSAPTLSQMRKVYGDNVTESWLSIQLNDLNESAGTEKKMNTDQIEQAAKTFAWKYHFLKLTEWMLFFQMFKSGEFGHFYGCVDSMKIGESIQAFLTYRANKLDQIMKAEAQRKMEAWKNDPGNMSYDQWVEKHKNEIV